MESCSPDSLTVPPQSLQSHNPLLGGFPQSPTQYCQNYSQFRREDQNVVASSQLTNCNECTREYNLSISPSRLHQAALAVLQVFDNQTVLAWLTGLRSFRTDENHWFQPESLSSEQFNAISVLKDCPVDLVSLWLDSVRGAGAFEGPPNLSSSRHLGTPIASANLLHKSWQGSSSTSWSSIGSSGALRSPYDGNTVSTTPTSSRSRETFLDLPTEPSIDEATQSFTTSHNHWCFICPNPRMITTCDGWKRHMKEHETRYRCMPRGPIEYTADGAKCAFCGFRDPSQSHCDSHRAFHCTNKPLDVRSYTRKPHFISHLNTHHVSNTAELANQWRDTNNKKHFSCGFCISHFYSLIEQLNHIDNDHYRHFQHVRQWDPNKVIRGLLLQPGVSESWRRILASHPDLTESFLRWDLSVMEKLQVRLELGNESVDTLARLAFNESTYDSTHHGEVETVDAIGLPCHNSIAATREAPVIQATPPIQFNLSERSVVDGNTINSINSSTSQMAPWAVTNNSIPPHNSLVLRSYPTMAEDYAGMGMPNPRLDTGQNFMTSGDNYRTEPDLSLSTPWASSKSVASNSTNPGGSLMMGNYRQGTTILSPMNSSIFPGQPRSQIQIQSLVGKKARARCPNPNLLPPSSDQKALPLPLTQSSASIFAGPGSFLGHQPRKHPSRSKLKDHYDINTEADIDLDMDFLQRLMREEDSTRSERRSR